MDFISVSGIFYVAFIIAGNRRIFDQQSIHVQL